MVDQRKDPKCHLQWNDVHTTLQLQRDFPPTLALKVCDAAVLVSPVSQCYLYIKQLNLCKSYNILQIHPMVEMSVHHC